MYNFTMNRKEMIKSMIMYVFAFIATIISLVGMLEFNESAVNDSSVQIFSLISLTSEPSILA